MSLDYSVGDTVMISCRMHFFHKWYFNDGEIVQKAIVENDDYKTTIIIPHLDLSDHGYYECEGRDRNGYSALARRLLIVRGNVHR